MNKKPKIIKHCLNCNIEFEVSQYRISVGRGKFCNKKCQYQLGFSKKHKKNISKNHHDVSGKNNPRWKGGISKPPCIDCGKIRKKTNIHKRCFDCSHKIQIGKNNPNWRGGTTKLSHRIRSSIKYFRWQDKCLKRDNYICTFCKIKRCKLNIDHIIPFSYILKNVQHWAKEFQINPYKFAMQFEPLWDIDNGRTLCIPCHQQTETYGIKARNWGFLNEHLMGRAVETAF